MWVSILTELERRGGRKREMCWHIKLPASNTQLLFSGQTTCNGCFAMAVNCMFWPGFFDGSEGSVQGLCRVCAGVCTVPV